MSGPWHCQRADSGLFVFHADTSPGLVINGEGGHPTELAAWEYGLSCLQMQREDLQAMITEARREVRRLRRSQS